MPRQAKPKAVPIEMPRTERDFDLLASAVEAHITQGNKIGKMLKEKKVTHKAALEMAGDRDEKLYNICDGLVMQRAEERDEQIAKEGNDE